MDGLNQEQREAVEAGEGPLMIIAGPGTGKTKTLTARIAYLAGQGVDPGRILALTFTKKAAAEIASRLKDVKARVTTFHGLCYELLNQELQFITEPRRLQLIKSLSKPAEYKGISARELGLLISRAKNEVNTDDPVLAKLVKAYDKALAAQGVCDFDDLLRRCYDLLAAGDSQTRFDHILVDEFQDTNRLQYELLKLLRGNDNLFVIGDPNQSIYGFRGASGTIFEQFKQDFPKASVISLSHNYRSVPAVVNLSNAIFVSGPQLQAVQTGEGWVRAVQVLNEYSEATWVLNEIQRAIGGGDFLKAVSDDHRETHRTLRDFAVLYRSRSAAQALTKLFNESGLPYQVVGDGSPYDRPEVQATTALLRAVASGETPELEGFSATQRQVVLELLQSSAQLAPSALAQKIMAILGFEPSLELTQFVNALVRFETIEAALKHLDVIAEQDFYDPQADAITLLTIHAAKGLEFPHVFVVGVEDGILPSKRAPVEEERRLFYVAATRAQERLDLLHAKHRGGQPATPSPFITNLTAEVLERLTDPDMQAQVKRIAKRAAKRSQQSLF